MRTEARGKIEEIIFPNKLFPKNTPLHEVRIVNFVKGRFKPFSDSLFSEKCKYDSSDCSIIGNIYENPEFVKEAIK